METINVQYINDTDGVRNPVIVLPTCKGIMVIPVPQIIRIQSISNYSKLFFKEACHATGWGKTLVVAKVLHWFEELPGLSSFVRIHRTHLINTNYIKTFSGGNFGILLLSNGEKFSVARRKKAGLSQKLNKLNNFFTDERVCASSFNTEKNFAA